MPGTHRLILFLVSAACAAPQAQSAPRDPLASPQANEPATTVAAPTPASQGGKPNGLMYTTYFYTAAEAVVHAYEDGTRARVARIEGERGTIWQGTLERGDTALVRTGTGVFAFYSDKKAGLLVGTPSSCSATGYFAADETGAYRSDYFLTTLPPALPGAKVLVWAYEDSGVRVVDRTSRTQLHAGTIQAGRFVEIGAQLGTMSQHLIEVSADRPTVAVQIYYDEGFSVPASSGRMTGRDFFTYLGTLTTTPDDLEIFAYGQGAGARVTDVVSGQTLWEGRIAGGGVHTVTLNGNYVRVTADQDVSVSVAPYQHFRGGYHEHHYAAGRDGTGIDREFLVTTQAELWIFSYYDNNTVRVTSKDTGTAAWQGKLGPGGVAALQPGWGFYEVKSDKGVSVMAGYGTCGGAFSPAGGMFAVDDALFAVIRQLKEQRQERAQQQGREATARELEAPLSPSELREVARTVRKAQSAPAATPAAAAAPPAPASMTEAEIIERAQSIESR